MGELRTHVPDEVHVALKTKAVEEGKRISEVVEDALRVYLNCKPNVVYEKEDQD
jgi:hypothetical protein